MKRFFLGWGLIGFFLVFWFLDAPEGRADLYIISWVFAGAMGLFFWFLRRYATIDMLRQDARTPLSGLKKTTQAIIKVAYWLLVIVTVIGVAKILGPLWVMVILLALIFLALVAHLY
jgi:hypothetical protein